MGVIYRRIDGERVSRQWWVLLHDIRKLDGVSFNVNEGHRTFARQWELYRLYRSGRGNLAAFPSPTAPHIRTGRPDHAIDFDHSDAVIAAARKRGVPLRRTVPGEAWHLEADTRALAWYFRRNRKRLIKPRRRK